MSTTTTQLLSSGQFCKLRYGTIPVKSASAKVFFSIPITQKCQILSCDTLVANERYTFIHSFHRHVHNATIPCRSQELLPFLSAMYFFLPPFPTNYSSILSHFILPSISWSTSQSCCSQIHISYSFRNSVFFHSLYVSKTNVIYLTVLSLLQ